MAYAITESAPAYANAHNDVIHAVYDSLRSNDQTTYPDFTYVCDVYVASVLVARLKAVPDPTYFAGVFNVKKILQDYMAAVSIPLPGDETIRLAFSSGRLAYQLKFGSEYGSTLTTNEIVDSSRYVYNSYDKYPSSNGGAELFNDQAGFKTSRPQRITIDENAIAAYIPFYNNTTGSVNVTGFTINASGGTIASISIAVAASGMTAINTTKTALETNIAYANAYGFGVSYGGSTYYFDWVCNPKFEPYTVGFMNKYGGFETYDFLKASSLPIQITRKQIDIMPYTTGVSGLITYNNPRGVTNNFSNKVGRKIKLKSDWVTDDVYVWLEQLVVSTQLYIYDLGYGSWVRVSLTNTDYEPKQFVKDGMSILELEFDFEGYSPQRL